jgi:phosphatidylserine/phosphatidylglycerophosphate/cardiolipin synthase-like enzyme
LIPLFLAGCNPGGIPATQGTPLESWYAIYFTESGGPGSETLRGGPDYALAEAIDTARLSVDIAMDDLDLWSVRNSLTAAHRRGLTVRVVVESDNIGVPEVQDLIVAGIPVVGDHGPGLMHDKFAILDRFEVWTGSMNLTLNGAYRSDNNLVRIRSAELARDYLAEFEEMFDEGRFGPGSPANTPNPVISIEDIQIEAYFAPEDETIDRLLELIEGAQESVYFLAYSFTDDDLAEALVNRVEDSVVVAGVMDEGQANSNIGSDYEFFLKHGLDVRLDGNPGSMHHKVIVIDGRFVVTGSYNFSNNARTRNDENTLVIHSVEVAGLFLEEFRRIYAAALN